MQTSTWDGTQRWMERPLQRYDKGYMSSTLEIHFDWQSWAKVRESGKMLRKKHLWQREPHKYTDEQSHRSKGMEDICIQ